MSQICAFANVRISLPSGWTDISDELPEGTPPTLAKQDGIGALQFSVARYRTGVRPEIGPESLDALLREFAETRMLGAAADVERGKSTSHYVGASFSRGGDLVRAWYATNGSDVALVTYVAEAGGRDAEVELAEAGGIVRSIDFD